MSGFVYGMVKGKLIYGVPYFSRYNAKPHYVLVLDIGGGKQATAVVNTRSDDLTEVGIHTDYSFSHPVVDQLRAAPTGQPDTFPRLDYQRDFKLMDESNWTPIPYEDDGQGGSKNDINDLLSDLACVDIDPETNAPVDYDFFNGVSTQKRQAFKCGADVTVVAFGATFPKSEQELGVHDAHMSQGTHLRAPHAQDNGIHQDGAVFFIVGDAVRAHFTVFSSQWLPTDSRGVPLPGADQVCPPIVER